MKVYKYTPGMRFSDARVVALGFFDGVHIGHREILSHAVKEAKKKSLISAAFTFCSETDAFKGKTRIYSTEEKSRLISECGIDEVIVADFGELCSLSAEDFVRDVLLYALGTVTAVSGEDFRFGCGAVGDVELLQRLLRDGGANLITPREVRINGEKISTSKVKELLEKGDVKGAQQLLGEPYYIKSVITHGLGLGKSFGFPTINTDIGEREPKLRRGVYKSSVEINSKLYNALTNIGTCPTVGERESHRETFILNFDGDLYGETIKINFLDFVREEKLFDSVEELKMQIKDDIKATFGSEEI